MISNIGDYVFMGILILFVLTSLIILYSKTSGSLEIGITVLISIVVLAVGIGTFFLGNYVNMLSMSGIIFVILCILIGGIIIFSNELTIESFSTLPKFIKRSTLCSWKHYVIYLVFVSSDI